MDTDAEISAAADEQFLQSLITQAMRSGATDAEVQGGNQRSLSIKVRNGAMEAAQHAESASIRLTAYVGKRKASLGTNQFAAPAIAEFVDRVIGMAKLAPEDPYCGLAPRDKVKSGSDEYLELYDPIDLAPRELISWCAEIEDAALAVPGVTQSDSASAFWGSGHSRHVASNGLSHASRASIFNAGVSVMAGTGDTKETAGELRGARWLEDLPSLEEIGRAAGEAAASKVGARKINSLRAAVIFDRRIAMSFIDPLVGAISGGSIARGVSFLKDQLHKPVFAKGIDIIDDPFKKRGLGSRAVDSDGVSPQRRKIVDSGVLTTWLLDCATARKLQSETTGHASGLYNLTLAPGEHDQAALMAEAGTGLLVTNHFSASLNPNTSEWSVGVAGFWFQNGKIEYPVSEVTVAGRLTDLYPEILAGSDLEIRGAANAPSLLIPQMSIGGR